MTPVAPSDKRKVCVIVEMDVDTILVVPSDVVSRTRAAVTQLLQPLLDPARPTERGYHRVAFSNMTVSVEVRSGERTVPKPMPLSHLRQLVEGWTKQKSLLSPTEKKILEDMLSEANESEASSGEGPLSVREDGRGK